MGKLLSFLSRRFSRKPAELPEEAADRLRVSFKERYHHFKLLLAANNRALELMAEIEGALRGDQPFGMAFVRSRVTEAAVNVLRMIKSLQRLAPGRYDALRTRFDHIRAEIMEGLGPERTERLDALVLGLEALDRSAAEVAGGKMAGLGDIRKRAGVAVPDGFVVTTTAYERFMSTSGLRDEIHRLFQSVAAEDTAGLYELSTRVQRLIADTPLPGDVARAIEEAWDRLAGPRGDGLRAALRSSSLFEDGQGSSFAGQFRTELNVAREHLLDAYREVVASKYSLHAITYRLRKGLRDEEVAVAVGCMAMVDAVSGGVAYTRSPVAAGDDAVHVSSVWGLPKAIVDGATAFDHYVVDRSPELRVREARIGSKETRFVCFPEEGVCRLEQTDAEAENPSLTEDQVLEVARIALRLESIYDAPQDIEWAFDREGRLILLQCRPLHVPARDCRDVEADAEPDPSAPLLLEGGIAASPGTASGPVFKAVKSADALRFPENGVLVVRQALPQWATLVGRASGIVTEKGGAAGHLASVAREFGVPAIFGCPGALETLEEGGTVTLDADRARVYGGRVDRLLETEACRPNPMAGSPVFTVLESASRLIVPLHLLDPASPDFRPEKCSTFHDITRFVHEKSVLEMFDFGREHHFPERSSKQLHYNVPMQWWVLNLDDGFEDEVTGRYVKLGNITSIPMRAFWEGFVAIPWEGPPPIDHRGFASVLFQSTANTALTPGVRSRYAEKNYFMVSRHYCNLNSRLGYHFSTMEAMVSERIHENYISFQFKGGAADADRRLRRVRFIGELLEGYGFRVEVREDHLSARAEQLECDVMKDKLRILGYLSLHTRQLDMIMANPSRVAYFQKKMQSDIRRMIDAAPRVCEV